MLPALLPAPRLLPLLRRAARAQDHVAVAPSDWDVGFETPPLSADALHCAAVTWHAGHQEVVSETVLTSSFNLDLADGWTYGWKSSRSQAIRGSRHHVTAYVFEVTPRGNWRLVAKAMSPGFTIATYRSSSAPRDDAALVPTLEHETSTALVSSRTQRMAYHLGLLLLYVGQVDTVSATAQHKLVQYLMHPAPVSSSPLHQLLKRNQTPPNDRTTSSVLVDWLIHLLHPHNRTQYEAVVRSHRDCILQRTDLARAYSDCVQLLHSVSEAFLAKQHQTSVAQVAVEAVASLASLSAEMTTRLVTDSFFGYQACVAHFREVSLSAEAAQSVWPEHRVLGVVRARSWLCGDWVVDVPSVRFVRHDALSAATLVRWASSLFRVRTTLLGPQLHVQSAWRVYVSQPTCFVLDGRPHVHRTWPNGESTMAGATRHLEGDYVGRLDDDAVDLRCYTLDVGDQTSYCATLHVATTEATRLQCTVELYQLRVAAASDVAAWTAHDRIALWENEAPTLVFSGDWSYERAADDL
ncbi:hypothetical protein SDRG_14063 [Saprolegnia diclina VS20]|uniref:Uncharacterized protein n=1 Tax=Saprolegnia diclina (strain VS20) TaxID=1156394 RepID=T0Q480_SAPDV|nr:hypothetical protein SDRG_14063 [Saprolegnia diclina VS20]EQC28240.1 hypothetical protein SDRG_14063 [Saprolegnia diclina VS20]|eukprot:XP_008618389.1 hypothetical protein SDRG_14063 [Saprolegnia diclina VS20]